MAPQPRHRQPWSRRLVSQPWPKKRYAFHIWCSWTNYDYALLVYCCLYTIIQLWMRRCCLAGCWKLSLNSQSYKDRVIEKLGLVSRWPDWLAFVMSQQGFCHWDTFNVTTFFMNDHITTGIIIRHVQNALPILILKNIDVNTLDEFTGIYKATVFSG